jgi:hypothetical protein
MRRVRFDETLAQFLAAEGRDELARACQVIARQVLPARALLNFTSSDTTARGVLTSSDALSAANSRSRPMRFTMRLMV